MNTEKISLLVDETGNEKYIYGVTYKVYEKENNTFSNSKISLNQAVKNYRKKYRINKNTKIELKTNNINLWYED